MRSNYMMNTYLPVKETVEAKATAVEVTITPRRAMRTMFAKEEATADCCKYQEEWRTI